MKVMNFRRRAFGTVGFLMVYSVLTMNLSWWQAVAALFSAGFAYYCWME